MVLEIQYHAMNTLQYSKFFTMGVLVMFKIIMGKGFHLKFENGNTISVQFGYGNYCENNKMEEMENVNLWNYERKSETAEIAVWDSNGNWITKRFIPDLDDNVKGYLSADEVAKIIAMVAKAKQDRIFEILYIESIFNLTL